jgi:hypothetical protein
MTSDLMPLCKVSPRGRVSNDPSEAIAAWNDDMARLNEAAARIQSDSAEIARLEARERQLMEALSLSHERLCIAQEPRRSEGPTAH